MSGMILRQQTYVQQKKQPTEKRNKLPEWKKIFTNYEYNKELICRLHNGLKQLNSKQQQ
jgi:hypothetical protein